MTKLQSDIAASERGEQEEPQHPRPPTRNSEHVRQPTARRASLQSGLSSEDGIEEEDSDEEGDESTALTKRRRLSWARRKTVPNIMTASTDLTASTELTRSRRYSTTFDGYSERDVLFSSVVMLKKRIIDLYVQLCELKSYVQLNKTGFRKVLKKFDKITERSLAQSYMDSTVLKAAPFRKETLEIIDENIGVMEDAYARIVTESNHETARRDLRSHLREHVVWERNTVWRDLIGIERRAEAASLGQTLLGRGGELAGPRLQGDGEAVTATKEIETPLGRLTYPAWLISASLLNLVIIASIFFVLPFVHILEKPEQQNCLAMLVFVSLLWATEVRDMKLHHTWLAEPFE